jgi:hypothetical protein
MWASTVGRMETVESFIAVYVFVIRCVPTTLSQGMGD